MTKLSTGTGIALLAGAIVAFPVVNRMSSIEHAASASSTPRTIATAAIAQTPQEPTIVWYSVVDMPMNNLGTLEIHYHFLYRAWSDGTVEYRRIQNNYADYQQICTPNYPPCASPWFRVNDPADGSAAAADINADESVNGADLATLLANWGPAPRHDIPPSDCPLNMINP